MYDREYLRVGKPGYLSLLEEAERDQAKRLDLRQHCFKAVAGGICRGYYSTLGMACQVVDESHGGTSGRKSQPPWEKVVDVAGDVGHNFVLNILSGQLYAREARVEMAGEGANGGIGETAYKVERAGS